MQGDPRVRVLDTISPVSRRPSASGCAEPPPSRWSIPRERVWRRAPDAIATSVLQSAISSPAIHVVTDHLEDLSHLLRSVGERNKPFPIVHGRGDGATHPAGRNPRTGPGAVLDGAPARDIYVPDLRIGSGIKVPTRDFR